MMLLLKTLWGIFFFLLFSVSAYCQTPFQTIEQYQDLRCADLTPVLSGLHDASPVIRERSALACANLQDSGSVTALITLLRDRESSVRRMAAFALGQIGGPAVQQPLLFGLSNEREIHVTGSILEALGKAGDSIALTRISRFADSVVSVELQREAGLSVAHFALRGVKSDRGIRTAVAFLSHADPGVRGNAVYALMRMSPLNIDTNLVIRLLPLLSDEDPYVSMNVATVLGKNKAVIAEDALRRSARFDPDWRVRVNALKALGQLPEISHETFTDIVELLEDTDEHISLTAFDMFPSVYQKVTIGIAQKQKVRTILKKVIADSSKATSWRQQSGAAMALAKIYGVEENAFVIGQLSRNPQRIPRMLEVISLIPEPGNLQILRYYLSRKDPMLAVAALHGMSSLISLLGNAGILLRKETAEDIQRQLLSEEAAIAATAADILTDSLFLNFVDLKYIVESASKYEYNNDPEVIVSILHLAGKKGGSDMKRLLEQYTRSKNRSTALTALKELNVPREDDRWNLAQRPAIPNHTDFDWSLLDSLQAKLPRYTIETTHGSFVIELFPVEAPFTSVLFTRLVRRGFYNTLTFHRVVPNFVVQGGDPSGTGWGGPGFSIRTEVSLLRYNRGMVGMASSGRDTEGSQFFITHSPQPHLDGKYTIFARVVEGMEIVDKIQIGDTISDVTMYEP
jgi:cyclophilin family peptidyl-prolyl cis-trans isomerase/HEAT repeat protein